MMQAHKAQSSGDMDEQLFMQQQQYNEDQPLSNLPGRIQTFDDNNNNNNNHHQHQNGGSHNNGNGNETTKGGLSAKTKTLSGLSLALMMSDEQQQDDSWEGGSTDEKDDKATPEEKAAAEKRRAALHSAPPQLFAMATSPANTGTSPLMKAVNAGGAGPTTTAGEYGYAYNNHIPTRSNAAGGGPPSTPGTPNTNNRSAHFNSQFLREQQQFPTSSSYNTSTSPLLRPTTPLGSTPPGYLLSATPSTFTMGGTPSSYGSAGLIPPRSAVTPPFVRPMGFVGEPPTQPLPPAAASHEQQQHHKNALQEDHTALHHHQTSLDLLHSSPFQYPPSHSYYSMHHHNNSSFGSGLHHGAGDTSDNAFFLSEDMNALRGHTGTEEFFDQDLSDDMPFAVDTLNSGSTPTNAAAAAGSTASGAAAAGGNSALTSMMNEASLVASICTAAPKRLAMFDSKHGGTGVGEQSSQSSQQLQSRHRQEENLTHAIDSLAEQLDDFKSFGASLMATSSGVAPFSPEAPTASAGSG